MNLFTKQKKAHRYWKQTYGYKGETWEGRGRKQELFLLPHVPASPLGASLRTYPIWYMNIQLIYVHCYGILHYINLEYLLPLLAY